jgi:CheY-like chemotaxis protein
MEHSEFAKLQKPIALIVDDEPFILRDTCDLLADEGYAIVEATSADEAYVFLSEHPSLQVLVTDVQMPGNLNGFELARKVAIRLPHIFIVVV